MKYFSIFNKNSRLFFSLKTVYGFEINLQTVQDSLEEDYIVIEGNYSNNSYLAEDLASVIIITEKKPSIFHQYNPSTQSWEISQQFLQRIKRDKFQQINQQREKLLEAPIVYQNITFDADQEAQRNLSGWTSAIANGTSLPSGFTWRDYYNQNHPITQEFLVGLAQAITIRGTQIYQISWQKKAELEALTSAEAAYNYDAITGWL